MFARIIAGELPGTFLHRDPECVSFLSINPISPGHVLVVPRAEVDEWTDLSPAAVSHLMGISHGIARAQKMAFDCRRVGLVVAGFEVPHCHVHVIPARSMADLSFENASTATDRSSLESVATELRRFLPSVGIEPAD